GSSGFASFLVQASGLTSTSFTPAAPFVNGAILYWRVRATNSVGDGPDSAVRNFTTAIGGPTQVVLVSPADGSDDIGATPTLVWQAVGGAANYRVQVSKVANFSSSIVHDTIIAGTQFQIGPLEFGQTYFWRVRASNAGSENWSAVADFATGSGAPAQVALESPQNDADDQPLSVTLAWSATAGAETYNLQVALDQNFTTILLSETGLTATNYVLGGLDHSTDYYWRVQAANGVGTGGWSAVRMFTTQVVLAPAAPALIYPPDGAENVHANPVFSWNETEGAASYKLELSTSPPDELENFVTVVIAVVVQQSFFQSPTLSVGQDYYWRVESRNAAGSARSPVRSFRTALTTSAEAEELPTEFSLEQNYPNPFNPSTTIRYNLPEAADVQLIVLDALGRVVDDLGSRRMAPGAHSVVWNAETRPSGLYFVRMQAKGFVGLRRMVLVR
ncbi:MAG TPA: T9SS type A sorting domain-containing protein, partial [Rhodothermia bacterium]|nr:T9SS type A sorting domain-containing protein [Rhodothermia bacterium]